jgi:hypothetical protein
MKKILALATIGSFMTSLSSMAAGTPLSILYEPLSVNDTLFDGSRPVVAQRNALCQLISVRIDNFLGDHAVQAKVSDAQRASLSRLKKRLAVGSFLPDRSSIKLSLGLLATFDGFDDILRLYELLEFTTEENLGGRPLDVVTPDYFPYDELSKKVTSSRLSNALLKYKDGAQEALLLVLTNGTAEEQRSAIACCYVILLSSCYLIIDAILDDDVRGITSCINLIQIYQQVEQLPIESVLQSMHCLIQRVGVMLANLNKEEGGFVGWLKNKWVYLPIALGIVIMRIARYYWGGGNVFGGGLFSASTSYWEPSPYSSFSTTNSACLPTFTPKNYDQNKNSGESQNNAEVVVGSASNKTCFRPKESYVQAS